MTEYISYKHKGLIPTTAFSGKERRVDFQLDSEISAN
jgi:hypothetical protein